MSHDGSAHHDEDLLLTGGGRCALADATPGSPSGERETPASIDVSIAMPVFNEKAMLPRVLEEAIEAMASADISTEILLVDDASTDGSAEVLEQWRERYPSLIRVVTHARNRGISAACQTLFDEARGKYVFLNASDGQWKTAECLRKMALRDRFDLIIGVRRRKHYTLWRKTISLAYNLLPRILFGLSTHDAGSIKLYKAEILQIPLISRGVFREAERIIRARRRGYRVGTIEVDHLPRTTGRASGARLSLIAEAVADCLRCWWRIVIRREA